MKKILLTAALAGGLCAGNLFAQQKGERNAKIDKALTQAYPDTPTELGAAETVNGVKVFSVKIDAKTGESTARVTEHGDFLNYGSAQQQGKGLTQMLTQNASGLFKTAPADVELYRSTNYFVDIPAPAAKSKNRKAQRAQDQKAMEEFGYRVRFDAVGRVLDIQNPDEVQAASHELSDERVSDEALAKRLTEKARQYLGDKGEVNGVFRAPEEGYYVVDLKGLGTSATINEEGQLLSYRRQVEGTELPQPVRQAVENMFTTASRSYKGEDAYFQFQQQAQTGNEVIVKMRPNGDILEVSNDEAAQDAKAAAAKQKGGAARKKAGA